MSDRYLVFWLRDDAPQADKLAIRNELYHRLHDDTVPATAGENKINWSKLPRWRLQATPAIVGRALIVPTANLARLNVDPANVTLSAFENWKSTHLEKPGYFQVARGNDYEAVLDAAGLEPVP